MTQTYILEALKRLKECIPSGTPTEHSGTGRRQHISRPFSALHPGSSVALSSSWASPMSSWVGEWTGCSHQVRSGPEGGNLTLASPYHCSP